MLMGLIGDKVPAPPAATVLVNSISQQFTGASSGNVTSAIDTTGATLLVAVMCFDLGITPGYTFVDSKSNTWALSPPTLRSNIITGPQCQMYYVNSVTPTVGSGHTFTFNGTNAFACMMIAAFKNSLTSPFDVENGATGSSTTADAGSITPSANNYLCVTGCCIGGVANATTVASATGGFTQIFNLAPVASQAYGGYMSYLKLGSSHPATDPALTLSPTNGWAMELASFKGT